MLSHPNAGCEKKMELAPWAWLGLPNECVIERQGAQYLDLFFHLILSLSLGNVNPTRINRLEGMIRFCLFLFPLVNGDSLNTPISVPRLLR